MKKAASTAIKSNEAEEQCLVSPEMLALHAVFYQQMEKLLILCERKINTFTSNKDAFDELKVRDLQGLAKMTQQLQKGMSDLMAEREAFILQRDQDVKAAIETGATLPKAKAADMPVTSQPEATPGRDGYTPFNKTERSIGETVGQFHNWESAKKPKVNSLSQRLPKPEGLEGSQSPF